MQDPSSTQRATRRDVDVTLEICVDTLAGARAAIAGGADQLELCGALSLGGLTPSSGLTRAVMAVARPVGVVVRAMVRPRAGDFVYDADEMATVIAESRALLEDGVDGLVFGATREDAPDQPALSSWVAAVRNTSDGKRALLGFHRAIDVVTDPVRAIDTIVELGFDQILSSGGASTALAGVDMLAAMTRHARGRCRIIAAAGVSPKNIDALLAHGLPPAVHASARKPYDGVEEIPSWFGFGQAPHPTDAAMVAALRKALDRHGR
jgi:copper homeostasis protein